MSKTAETPPTETPAQTATGEQMRKGVVCVACGLRSRSEFIVKANRCVSPTACGYRQRINERNRLRRQVPT